MSLTKKVAHNTLTQIVGKIISTILGLFSIALITRYLGKTGFGEYTTVITFLTFFAVTADFGLTLVTSQMISARNIDENKILNNLFSFRLVSALFFLSLAPLIVIFFPYSPAIKFGVLITFISFLFPALNQIIVGLFQKKLCIDKDAIGEVVSRAVLIIGIILTKKWNAGLNGILITTVVSAASSFLIHYFFALKFTVIKLEFDWQIWKKIISKSWPLAITIVLNLIYLRADTLLLSLFRSVEDVGLYGATYRIIDILTTIPFMFAGLILPILTTAWFDKNYDYFKSSLQKSFDFMALLAIPLVAGAWFIGRPIMIYAAGSDFANSGDILRVLIFAVAAIFLGTMFSHAVIAIDKQKKMIGFYVFVSISSLVGYLVLIPKFSYFGAAAVTIYSELMIALFSACCVYKYTKFLPNIKVILKAIASSLIMGLFLNYFSAAAESSLGNLIMIFSGASLIYFISLFLMGGVKKSDLATIFKRQTKGAESTFSGYNV